MLNRNIVRTLFSSRLARKEDPALLANALGLLLPKKNVKSASAYRPLIFRHLQKGDVTENYAEIRRELLPEPAIPSSIDHSQQVNFLLMDLQAAAAKMPSKSKALEKNLLKHVTALQSEDELIELVCLSLQQNKLSLALLTRFLLNRHLKQLHRLPFNIDNLDRTLFCRNGWTQQNFVEFDVLLMKKYHDLNKPLMIVKILREQFEGLFLPLIQSRLLLAFYERIVWKFYFEYQLHPERNETYYVKSLNNLRSTLSMWESSSHNNRAILETALKVHEDLSPLQRTFIQLCVSEPAQATIAKQLETGRSRLLGELKKISIRYKLAGVASASDSDSVAIRAHGYSLIHAVESLIKREFPNWASHKQLATMMGNLARERAEMAHTGLEVDESMALA